MSALQFIVSFLLAGVIASPVKKDILAPVARNGVYGADVVDQLRDATMPNVQAWMSTKNYTASYASSTCTLENAAVRREWSDLSVPEREEYIRAVLCLQAKPSRAPKDKVPGALSRYDDFVATHMTQAMMLHDPTHLFASHKYFIWTFEHALREECGYTGYQPYMNYERYADDPINSPMFNGNTSSMGGNGGPSTYLGVIQPFPKPYNMIPSAGGGGCMTEGPFKDMVVSLGPIGGVLTGVPKNPQSDGLGSNPRCIRRDVNKYSVAGARANYTMDLIMNNTGIDAFYNRYLGSPQLKGDPHPWGLHNSGHYMFGGDPGGDFFASPGDPAFWFHHGMLDRVWWIWQMQDPVNRINLIPGAGAPPMGPMRTKGRRTENATADPPGEVIVDLGWTAGPIALKYLNDQLGGNNGQFCYIYA